MLLALYAIIVIFFNLRLPPGPLKVGLPDGFWFHLHSPPWPPEGGIARWFQVTKVFFKMCYLVSPLGVRGID